MGDTAPKVEIVEWRDRVKAEEDLDIDEICDHIANGGTLAKYCMDRSLMFADVSRWIKKQDYRKKKVAEAKELGNDLARQLMTELVVNLTRFDMSDASLPGTTTLLPPDKWPTHVRACVEQVEWNEKDGLRVKFTPRTKALDMVGKIAGIYEQKVTHEAGSSLKELIEQSQKGKKDGGKG
jgi:hypothetical protein